MEKFSGIESASNNAVVVVSDERIRWCMNSGMPTNWQGSWRRWSPIVSELVGVVVESTYNWYWLVDGLMEAGLCRSPGEHRGDQEVRRA